MVPLSLAVEHLGVAMGVAMVVVVVQAGEAINLAQQRTLSIYYHQLARDEGMARDVPIASNVANKGALAQALNMVGNCPVDNRTVLNLRKAVDRVHHPVIPSHTTIGILIQASPMANPDDIK